MKVKNIMFSGFMAVILMGVAGNASAAAVQIASKAYVDGELASKASNADLGAANEAIAQNAENIAKKADQSYVGTLPTGITATDIVGYIQEKTAGIATEGAMTELSGRVTAAEGKVTALEGKMTTAEGDIDALESAMTGTGEGSVAAKISSAVSDAKGELTTEINKKADSSTVDGISGRVTALENADYQNAEDVSGAITTAISDLNLAGTYEAKGAAATVQANVNTLSGTVDGISAKVTANEGAISTLQGDVATKAAASDVTALGERVTTAEGEIDTLQSDMTAAQGNITTLQGDVAKKVDQTAYDTKVNELNTAIAGNTTKIGENTAKIGQVEATANAAIPMPEGACATGANCVLSTVGGTIQWVNITEPLQ